MTGEDVPSAELLWVHAGGGSKLVALNRDGTRPSPFLALPGRLNAKTAAAVHAGRYGVCMVKDVGEYMHQDREHYKMRLKRSTWRLSWHGPRHVTSVAALRREVRRRQRRAGQLMAGWNALADLCGVQPPAAARRLKGRGHARIHTQKGHVARLTASNETGYYPYLQRIVARQHNAVGKKFKSVAARRTAILKKIIRRQYT